MRAARPLSVDTALLAVCVLGVNWVTGASLGIGLVLSIAVLYFFLRHWPSTLMVTLAIPICFVMTLGFMYFAGVTLNILSMMGLLLAVGMLVDNAVVVVESIYQEREKNPGQPRLASILGTRHVAIALSAGTLCHCIVFVPNLFGERNFLAIYLSQIAITISVSLLASWLVAVSLIPMISARLKTPPTVGNKADSNGLIPRLQRRYARFLRWTLEHRGKSVLGIVLIIAISIVPMMLTKKNMFGGGGGEQVRQVAPTVRATRHVNHFAGVDVDPVQQLFRPVLVNGFFQLGCGDTRFQTQGDLRSWLGMRDVPTLGFSPRLTDALRQFGQRLLAFDRGKRHFRLKGRAVVPARSSAHGLS